MKIHIFHRWEYSEYNGPNAYRSRKCLHCPRKERFHPEAEAGWSEDRTPDQPAPIVADRSKRYHARNAATLFANVEAAADRLGHPMTVREFLVACAEDGPDEPPTWTLKSLNEAEAALEQTLARTDAMWRNAAEENDRRQQGNATYFDGWVQRLEGLLIAVKGFQHPQKTAIEAAIVETIRDTRERANEHRTTRTEWQKVKTEALASARSRVDYCRREHEKAEAARQARDAWHAAFRAAVDILAMAERK